MSSKVCQNNMSKPGSLEILVSDYLNKVKKGNDSEELCYAENLPKTESVADLLNRVTKTPQILQSLITTSLPYLLITPQKSSKKKPMKSNTKLLESRKGKKRVNKKSVFKATPPELSESQPTSKLQLNRQNETTKKKLPTKKRSKTTNKPKQSNTNLTRDENPKDSGILISKKKKIITKQDQIIPDSLKKSLLEDSINAQNKITNALKHSSLFSITEKSYLSLNNYAPVEVDTLLLQKLIALDKKSAKEVINNVLKVDDGFTVAESESSESDDTSEIVDQIKKKKTKKLKRKIVKELKMILLTRLKSDKERPAEILYNVTLKLCKKNKIVNGLQFKRVQKVKKPTQTTSRFTSGMTSKRLKLGSEKLRALINQHQQLLEKMHP